MTRRREEGEKCYPPILSPLEKQTKVGIRKQTKVGYRKYPHFLPYLHAGHVASSAYQDETIKFSSCMSFDTSILTDTATKSKQIINRKNSWINIQLCIREKESIIACIAWKYRCILSVSV